jgi:hypothetical protein
VRERLDVLRQNKGGRRMDHGAARPLAAGMHTIGWGLIGPHGPAWVRRSVPLTAALAQARSPGLEAEVASRAASCPKNYTERGPPIDAFSPRIRYTLRLALSAASPFEERHPAVTCFTCRSRARHYAHGSPPPRSKRWPRRFCPAGKGRNADEERP